jgi:hypothetical protein
VRQNGLREYESEYKKVIEYLREEARYILRDEIGEAVREVNKVIDEVNLVTEENNVLENINNIINGIGETLNEVENVKVINLEAEKESSDVKNKQRAKEKVRREYMKANNIDITELFTVDNVRKWLNDGRSYAWIASEQLGCKQEEVSRFAKMNKIK